MFFSNSATYSVMQYGQKKQAGFLHTTHEIPSLFLFSLSIDSISFFSSFLILFFISRLCSNQEIISFERHKWQIGFEIGSWQSLHISLIYSLLIFQDKAIRRFLFINLIKMVLIPIKKYLKWFFSHSAWQKRFLRKK